MQDELTELGKLVTALHPLADKEWQAFSAIWKPHSATRKQLLTRSGETEKYLYFVTAGVQRMYHFDEQEREATILFTYAPSFGGVLDSLLLQQPSRYFYETLTPSCFLRTTLTQLQPLIQNHPGVEVMMQKGITVALSGVLQRLVELQAFSSEEKFKTLLHRSPHLLQLVPQKYLANYLGIDATNFSKLLHSVRL